MYYETPPPQMVNLVHQKKLCLHVSLKVKISIKVSLPYSPTIVDNICYIVNHHIDTKVTAFGK